VDGRYIAPMRRPRSLARKAALLACFATVFVAFASSSALGAPPERNARIPCTNYNTELGEYGAYVFQLRHKPTHCVQYEGNRPCHCTESQLTRIRWRNWGGAHATARATWRYCGMGLCINLRASLVASRMQHRCGPVYTRLRMRVPGQRDKGRMYDGFRDVFRLPACRSVFDYT
jgi:hypothetical protein